MTNTATRSGPETSVAYDSLFNGPQRGMVEVGGSPQARRYVRDALGSDRTRMSEAGAEHMFAGRTRKTDTG